MSKSQLVIALRQYKTYLMLYRASLRPLYLEQAEQIYSQLEGELFYNGLSLKPLHRVNYKKRGQY
jgi:hypothetical protein